MNQEEKILTILESMQGDLSTINTRLDAMDKRFDAMDERLDAMDERFDNIDEALERIETTANENGKWIDRAASVVGIPYPVRNIS